MEKHTKDGSLLTAEKFLPKNENGRYSRNEVETAMIVFAKMHVEAALKEASENAKASLGKDWIRKEETIHPGQLVDSITIRVNKDSILNSYPLSNIK
jgi:hypothetical protein